MPPKVLIQSEAVRTATIGCVMLLVLLTAIGAAWLTTGSRHVQVNHLALNVPRAWRNAGSPKGVGGELTNVSVIRPNGSASTSLLVALMRSQAARSVQTAMRQALGALQLDAARKASVSELRAGKMVGYTWSGLRPLSQRGIVHFEMHMVAVLTEDGRRYWAIHLQKIWAGGSDWQHAPYPRALFRKILNSARSHQTRPATTSDFEAATLPPQLSDVLAARVTIEHEPGDPIQLLVPNEGPELCTVRILGAPDSNATDSSDPLWPGTLMAEHFRFTLGRDPQPDDVRQTTLGGVPVWHVRFAEPSQPPTLERQLHYARPAPGRAALLEVIGRPDAISKQQPWFTTTLKTICRQIESSATSPQNTFAAAMERGTNVVNLQWQRLGRPSGDTQYYLITQPQRLAGYEIDQLQPSGPTGNTIISGWLGRLLRTTGVVTHDAHWTAAHDGTRFTWDRQIVHQSRPQLKTTTRYDLEDKQIQVMRAGAANDRTGWRRPAPPALMPPGNDTWPTALLEPEAKPVLLWDCDMQSPPYPVWVHAQPRTVSDRTGALVPRTLMVRPLLSLDADRVRVDGEGRMIQHERRARPLEPLGGETLTWQRVSQTVFEGKIRASKLASKWFEYQRLRAQQMDQNGL